MGQFDLNTVFEGWEICDKVAKISEFDKFSEVARACVSQSPSNYHSAISSFFKNLKTHSILWRMVPKNIIWQHDIYRQNDRAKYREQVNIEFHNVLKKRTDSFAWNSMLLTPGARVLEKHSHSHICTGLKSPAHIGSLCNMVSYNNTGSSNRCCRFEGKSSSFEWDSIDRVSF